MNPTEEQSAINQSTENELIVQALSGTGKTSTLVTYAKARPNERMLYLALNKSAATDAAKRFPSNVVCKTTHALAFPRFGSKYVKKLGDLKPNTISRHYNVPAKEAQDAIGIVTGFIGSWLTRFDQISARPGREAAEALAERLWHDMQDEKNLDIPQTHDGYLKLYQMSNPELHYRRILLDEAQDSNPAVINIVSNQERAGKVIVGDPNQQIYAFRGAINAMSQFNGPIYPLTQSFRFGAAVADLANAILSLKAETLILRGAGPDTKLVRQPPANLSGWMQISRTNAGVFQQVVNAINSNPTGSADLYFVGGSRGYRFDRILDAWHLKNDRLGDMQDRYLASFKSFNYMEQVGNETDDPELKMIARVVKEFGSLIPKLISQVQSRETNDVAKAAHCFSTAHKSKGLEFAHVTMSDDFPTIADLREQISDNKGSLTIATANEINLLYVAATRAIHSLAPGADLNLFTAEYHASRQMREFA